MTRLACFGALFLCGVAAPVFAQNVVGDWVGKMNGGFKVRVHLEKSASGYTGVLTNPSGNETAIDEVTSDGTHLHFAITKLNLSYDGTWNSEEKVWNGSLNFQQVYPLVLRRATAADLAPAEHKRPQEAAILAESRPYVERDVRFEQSGCAHRAGRNAERTERDGSVPCGGAYLGHRAQHAR